MTFMKQTQKKRGTTRKWWKSSTWINISHLPQDICSRFISFQFGEHTISSSTAFEFHFIPAGLCVQYSHSSTISIFPFGLSIRTPASKTTSAEKWKVFELHSVFIFFHYRNTASIRIVEKSNKFEKIKRKKYSQDRWSEKCWFLIFFVSALQQFCQHGNFVSHLLVRERHLSHRLLALILFLTKQRILNFNIQ